MKITIEGTPGEIAALVVGVQGRQPECFACTDLSSEAWVPECSHGIVRTMEKVATGASSEDNQRSPCSDTNTNCV